SPCGTPKDCDCRTIGDLSEKRDAFTSFNVYKHKIASKTIFKRMLGIVLFLILSDDAMKQLCYITFPESDGFVKTDFVKNPFSSM
ncbi:hypothetical protein, partial [Shewanella putrefaciens]|uniref:hypothetical protein n=1 Tax=Shewanella putrefaciens TaxID=24 RepID=UPI003568CAA1